MFFFFFVISFALIGIFQYLFNSSSLEVNQSIAVIVPNFLVLGFLFLIASRDRDFWRERAPRMFWLLPFTTIAAYGLFIWGFHQGDSLEGSREFYGWFYGLTAILLILNFAPIIYQLSQFLTKNKRVGKALGFVMVMGLMAPYFLEDKESLQGKSYRLDPASPQGITCRELLEKKKAWPLFYPVYGLLSSSLRCFYLEEEGELPTAFGGETWFFLPVEAQQEKTEP